MQSKLGMTAAILFKSLTAFTFAGWSALALAQTPAATAQAPVRIFAWARHEGNRVRYSYIVQNNGAYPVQRLLIGLYQPDVGTGAADLNVMPRLNGNSLWLLPAGTLSPPCWHVKASYPDDSKKFALEWISANYHAALWPAAPAVPAPSGASSGCKPVLPGTTANNFSVMLDEADNAYVQGRANLDYGDASLNLQIEKADAIAPTLELDVHQTRRGGDWVAFDVRLGMADNYDPAPVLKWPTVVANQGLSPNDYVVEQKPFGWRVSFRNIAGRYYQAQFVAVDASGNATLRTVDFQAKGPPGNGR